MQAAQQLWWVVTGVLFVNSTTWSVVTSGSAGFTAREPEREPQSYLLERLGTSTTQKTQGKEKVAITCFVKFIRKITTVQKDNK